jgi:glycosyltransferase involved in cell wall biosynthesis
MNPMKIAYIFTPIEFGGAERVNLTLLQNIDRKRFNIHLVLLIRPWEKENIFVKKIEQEHYPIFKVPVAIKSRDEGKDYFRVIRCFKMIYSFLKSGSFDLVHTHGYFADVLGIIAARILHISTTSTCHGFISNDINLRFYNNLDRFVLRYANNIVAVSESIKNELMKNGIQGSNICVIQNAVVGRDHSEYHIQNRKARRQLLHITETDFVVGYIGRLSEEKGIRYLIEAGSSLIKSGMPVKMIIIGDGPQRKELEDLSNMAMMKDKIFFTGFQHDVESWLSAMDTFVLPSLTEGTPMALLEAMANGTPVVASAVGGVPAVIDSEKNGILVSPGRPEEIKKAMARLYKDELLRNNLIRGARQTINIKFNIKDWVRKMEKEYLKAFNMGAI